MKKRKVIKIKCPICNAELDQETYYDYINEDTSYYNFCENCGWDDYPDEYLSEKTEMKLKLIVTKNRGTTKTETTTYCTTTKEKEFIMARTNIPRTEKGKFAYQLEGIREFTANVAKDLLKKYPDVDYFDLETQFNSAFGHQYALAMMKENVE